MKTTLSPGNELYHHVRLIWDKTDTTEQIAKVVIETSYPLLLTQSQFPALLPDTVRKDYKVLEFAHLEVYGVDVTIHGPISAPGKTVSIVARTVHTRPSEKGLPKISVDGAAGAAPRAAALQGAAAKGDDKNTRGKKANGDHGGKGSGAKIPGFDKPIQTSGGRGEGRMDEKHNCDPYGVYDPVMDGEPGDDGDPGKAGGTIVLHAWKLDLWWEPGTLTPLELSARGGVGGRGQDGQPGADGGNGG